MLETIAILCLVYFGLWYIGWFAGGVCTNSKRLDDKIVVITGGNTGIGYEAALDLARRGATIIMGCRDVKKAQKAAEKIKTVTKEVVHVIPLDLASLASVRKFAEEIKALTTKVDILINNAGIMIGDGRNTEDKLELHMQVNHLGHFLLTILLEDNLLNASKEENADVRIINVSSDGHKFTMKKGLDIDDPLFGTEEWKYSGYFKHHRYYGQSKLAQIYFTKELAERYKNIFTSFSLHPGAVNTEITRYHNTGLGSIFTNMAENGLRFFGKTPYEGAQTTIFCCVDDEIKTLSGEYFVDCKKAGIFPWLQDSRKQKMLWDVSKKLVHLE